MKKNLPVTDQEVAFPENGEIISTTDLKGVLTSINDIFLDISGFTKEELLGKSHNVVRHPEMPPAAFKNLWGDLKEGKPWMGIVKNRCKNGDYYWVDAFVTPIIEGGVTIGYESVRVKPDAAVLARAETLYRDFNKGVSNPIKASMSISKGIVVGVSVLMSILVAVAVLMGGALVPVLVAGVVAIFASVGIVSMLFNPVADVAGATKHFADNSLAQYVYTGRSDEIGQMQFANLMLEARLRTVLGRVKESASQVGTSAVDMLHTAREALADVENQKVETDKVASIMDEMSLAVHEAAHSASNTSAAATEANDRVESGKAVLNETTAAIAELSRYMEHSTEVITQLENESENIRAVLDVICGIADQTNLLALNAAIEAARAGEHGRGFAVVAEEVRSLAIRTQDSTVEIQKMVELLQSRSRETNKAMKQGMEQTNRSVTQVEKVHGEFESIASMISEINNMMLNIASAVEEQSQVAEVIRENITNINVLAGHTATKSQEVGVSCEGLSKKAANMNNMVARFSVS